MPASSPGAITRFGLALVAPRWALAVADQPAHAGRSGSDLIRLLGILLVAAHPRRIVAAVWLATEIGAGAGLRGVVAALSQALTVTLAFLVLATLGVWVASGPRRAIGRAFDLVCVATVPLIAIELVATAVVRGFDVEAPGGVMLVLSAAAFAWAGSLVALAWRQARLAPPGPVEVPAQVIARGTRTGVALVLVALIGVAVNVAWIVRNADLLRPMTAGDVAPAFALPEVDAAGKAAGVRALADWQGKIVVVDFWATWCGPCVDSLPGLARLHADLGGDGAVVLVNLDDPADARDLVDRHAPGLPLLYDTSGDVARRYGVEPLPHTVVIDRDGRVRSVHRGGGADLRAIVARLRAARP
jgi:peroxiredoxin